MNEVNAHQCQKEYENLLPFAVVYFTRDHGADLAPGQDPGDRPHEWGNSRFRVDGDMNERRDEACLESDENAWNGQEKTDTESSGF